MKKRTQKTPKQGKSELLTYLAVGTAAAVAGAIAYGKIVKDDYWWIYNMHKADVIIPTPSGAVGVAASTSTAAPTSTSSTAAVSDYRTLYSRSPKDMYVDALQRFLNEKAGAGLVVDGLYGGKTTIAADAYMKKEGIAPAEFAKRIAIWDGKASSTGTGSVATSSSAQAEADAKQLNIWLRYNTVFGVPEDKIVALLVGKSRAEYEKIGYFYANKFAIGENLNIDLKEKLSTANANKIFSSLKGLGQISSNDVVTIADAVVYDMNGEPQPNFTAGKKSLSVPANTILGKVQGTDELSYHFITGEGKLRKVRKSQAVLALAA